MIHMTPKRNSHHQQVKNVKTTIRFKELLKRIFSCKYTTNIKEEEDIAVTFYRIYQKKQIEKNNIVKCKRPKRRKKVKIREGWHLIVQCKKWRK